MLFLVYKQSADCHTIYMLFLLYINDQAEVVKCDLKMFADDTCLYLMVDDPNASATCISFNENLYKVQIWDNHWLVNG